MVCFVNVNKDYCVILLYKSIEIAGRGEEGGAADLKTFGSREEQTVQDQNFPVPKKAKLYLEVINK